MPTMNAQDADTFLGAAPDAGTAASAGMTAHDANQFLGPITGPHLGPGGVPAVGSYMPPDPTPESDSFLARTSIGRVLDAFGQGAASNFGTEPLGFSPETDAALQKFGLFNDVKQGQHDLLRSINGAIMRPAAAGLDLFNRGIGALIGGAQEAVKQTGVEAGLPEVGQTGAELIDFAAMGAPGLHGVAPHAPEAPHPLAGAVPDLATAHDMGIVGQPESVWKGTAEPVPANESAVKAQVAEAQQAAKDAPGEPVAAPAAEPLGDPAPATATVPTDVHGLARAMAPDTFAEYDPLVAHQADLRQQIADAQASLQKGFEDQAPHAAEIADLEARMQDTTPRLAKKYQARLDAMTPERDAFLADDDGRALVTRDTPEITALRQQLLETDYRMRDLAPDVTRAYSAAAEQMPTPEEPATEAPGEITPESQVAPAETQPVEAQKAPEEIGQPAASAKGLGTTDTLPPIPSIAADVSGKLQAAGRPLDEANAAGQVSEAMWRTRAAAFEGRKGTAEEMYAREAPDIRAGREKAREREFAQNSAGQTPIAVQGDELGDMNAPGARDAARAEYERQASGGAVRNPSLGDVLFSRSGSKKTVAALRPDVFRMLPKLREIIENGKLIATVQDTKGREDVKAFHTLEAPVRIGNRDGVARVVIREDANGKFHYDLQRHDAAPLAEAIPDGAASGSKARQTVPSPDTLGGPPLPKTLEQGGVPREDVNLDVNPVQRRAGAQGKIRLTQDGRSVITLMKNADASTFLHETGHDWLERMMRDAGDPDAPASMKTDAKTVRDYLGVGEGEQIPTRGHEKLARSFERYFMEGRAPTKALADVFGKFKNWLTAIYQTVAKLRAPITPDIRDVFDRLLSTESERTAIVPEGTSDLAERPPLAPSGRSPSAATSSLADLHEADLDNTDPEDAVPVATKVRQEIDETIKSDAPDVGEEFADTRTRGAEPGGGAGGDAEAPGDTGADGAEAGTDARPAPSAEQSGAVNEGRGRAPSDGDTASKPDGGSANTPFGRTDAELIDKAGNIRLDNLNQPEDVNQVIREAAAANNDFINARRGVISDAQVLDLADALGMKAADLDTRKLGQAFNAEQVVAARKLLIQSAQDVRDAAAKAAEGSDADVMAYAETAARHRMIQEQVSGITAEAGRALRAFRSIGKEGQQAKALGDFLQAQTGRTLNQMRREAKAATLLDTPQQVSKFVQDSGKPTFGDMAMEYWINGLISGPATHTTYAIGNAVLAIWKAGPETAAASVVGRVLGSADRVRGGEVSAGLYALIKGQRDGIRAAWKAAKSGLTTELPGESDGGAQTSMLAMQPRGGQGAIPGRLGEVIRLPSRGVATIHSYFRAIGYEQGIAQMAYRQAASEGLAGDALAARVADLTTNPPPEMMEAARAAATDQTLMNGGGEFTRALSELTNKKLLGLPILKIVDPFVKISANVMTQALLERSPLGVLDPDIRANLMGRNGTVARDTQIARIGVGSALCATTIGLAAQGFITGGGPGDPREAAVWRMTGKQPYSVRIGDTWYSMHRLGPLAMIMGVGADMYEFGQNMETKDASHIGGLLVGSVTKGLLNESFMRGPADLIQALEDPDRYGARYVRDQLGTLLPFSTAMEQMARASDPYAREARTTMDSLKARIPWLSQTLLPRNDIWGQPMANKDDLGAAGLTAISETRANNDPVNLAMLRLGVFPAAPERKIVGVDLTDEQYDSFTRMAGRMAKMRLDAIVGTPGFSSLPDGVQSKAIIDTIEHARQAARELTKMQNPHIIQQAMANKRIVMTEGRAALNR